MGDVEAAAPGHQELAADARHGVEHDDAGAGLRCGVGRHQPGRPGADDRHIDGFRARILHRATDHAGAGSRKRLRRGAEAFICGR